MNLAFFFYELCHFPQIVRSDAILGQMFEIAPSHTVIIIRRPDIYWCNNFFLLSVQLMLCEDTRGNKFLVKAINDYDRPWNSEEVNMFFFFSHESCHFHYN